jgi:hypothetical protein
MAGSYRAAALRAIEMDIFANLKLGEEGGINGSTPSSAKATGPTTT